jgi:predicted AlkP superfamily phosphohydrolase/phosphomutase/tetratricopeptide (TPR) repeat protein
MSSMSSRRRVLLVGWDGADWRFIAPLLEAGRLPSLESLIERGVLSDLTTLEPLVCPMLWTSVVTGRRADGHGILGYVEPDDSGTLHLARSTSRRTKAVWNILTHAGFRSLVIGWPASHPAEPIEGVSVSDRFGKNLASPLPSGTIHPERLEAPLASLRLRPEEITAAHLAPFVPRLRDLRAENDDRLDSIAEALAECATVHAAATWLVENEPWDFCAVHYEAVASISRRFVGFREGGSESVPVREDERAAFQEVVDGIYRFHDMMLGRLLELAGSDVTVVLVSDHGITSPASPDGGHRARGLLVAAGPGLRRDERIYGGSLLDVAPTILTLFGVAVGNDMEGRVLEAAWTGAVAGASVPSWESIRGRFGLPGDRSEPCEDVPVQASANPPPCLDAAAALRYNLARSLLGADRAEAACSILEDLRKTLPGEAHLALLHAHALYALGNYERCREVLRAFDAASDRDPMCDVLMGFLAFRAGRADETAERLARAERAGQRLPRLHREIGNAYLQMGKWDDAVRVFRTALAMDGEQARTRDGLAAALLELNRPEEAADEALHAVWLQHDLAPAHFHLGAALARIGDRARAIEAFETCLSLDDRAAAAHLWLARLYESGALNLEKALFHRRSASEILERV